MANNYAPATIRPNLTLSEDQIKMLELYGVTAKPENSKYYCYIVCSEVINYLQEYNNQPATLAEYLLEQKATISPDEPIIVEGAYYCDKMRCNEFGGFCTVIDKGIKHADTAQLIHDILNGDY